MKINMNDKCLCENCGSQKIIKHFEVCESCGSEGYHLVPRNLNEEENQR